MAGWRRLVENRIQDAIADGQFDNLPGAGRPLPLDDDAFAGEWGMANRLLVANRMVPSWIEERRELVAEAAEIRARAAAGGDPHELERHVDEHNRRVLSHNLRSPVKRSPLPQIPKGVMATQKT